MKTCFGLLAAILCLYACRDNDKIMQDMSSFYTQEENIQLVNPRIDIDHLIIDTASNVTASLAIKDASIHYTFDGSEPSTSSQKYNGSFNVSKPATYRFKAYHPNFISSEIEEVTFLRKGVTPKIIDLKTVLNKQYPGNGITTLINNKRGSINFRDGSWLGMNEPIIAEVIFEKSIFLQSIDIGYMINTGAWIFPMESVVVKISEDGENFTKIEVAEKPKTLTKDLSKLDHFTIPISKVFYSRHRTCF